MRSSAYTQLKWKTKSENLQTDLEFIDVLLTNFGGNWLSPLVRDPSRRRIAALMLQTNKQTHMDAVKVIRQILHGDWCYTANLYGPVTVTLLSKWAKLLEILYCNLVKKIFWDNSEWKKLKSLKTFVIYLDFKEFKVKNIKKK